MARRKARGLPLKGCDVLDLDDGVVDHESTAMDKAISERLSSCSPICRGARCRPAPAARDGRKMVAELRRNMKITMHDPAQTVSSHVTLPRRLSERGWSWLRSEKEFILRQPGDRAGERHHRFDLGHGLDEVRGLRHWTARMMAASG